MRRISLFSSGVLHIAVVTACVLGVHFEQRDRDRHFEVRIDHQQASIAALPSADESTRPTPRPTVLDPLDRPVVTPEVEPHRPPPEDTFGLPLRPTEESPEESTEDRHRTANDDEAFDLTQPIGQRIVFRDAQPIVDPESTNPDAVDDDATTATESESTMPETSTTASSPRSGARARLSGRVRAPSYPDRAIQMRWEGDVVVEFGIDSTGQVTDAVAVDDLSCRYGLLKREAAKAVRTWSFDPATEDGRAVSSRLRIRIRFRLRGGVGVDVDEWIEPDADRPDGASEPNP